MRILFLTLYPDTAASPRYRVGQFVPYLQQAGFDCTVCAPLSVAQYDRFTGSGRPFWYHFHETKNRVAQLLSARHYDILFLQKALTTAYVRGLPALLKRFHGKIVYDIDDAVHLAAPHVLRRRWSFLVEAEQIRKIVGMSDLVLAGNRWLEEELAAIGVPTECFPTVVDTERFKPADSNSSVEDVYRLGWIGSPSTTPQLGAIQGTLNGLKDAEVVLVGADSKQLQCDGAHYIPWQHEEEVETVQQFSVGLMPQHKDPWSRGKCALKALQYMACGKPCITTPYGAARDIIRHGENGLFADTEEEWEAAIHRLRDTSLRQKLGDTARNDVEKKYSLQCAAPRLKQFLETLG